MRDYNSVYADKVMISEKYKEDMIVEGYQKILSALMEDNNVRNIGELEHGERMSFESKLQECFNINEGITEKGKSYLVDRKQFLTESSTNDERMTFLSKKIHSILEESVYLGGMKEKIYEAFNDIYVGVKATKFDEALSMKDFERCVRESFANYISQTLIKEMKNEIGSE